LILDPSFLEGLELGGCSRKTPARTKLAATMPWIRTRCLGLTALLLAGLVNFARAEEEVFLLPSGSMRCQVLDYTGREIRVRLSSGAERSYPADRVVKVVTDYQPQHVTADGLLAQHQTRLALEQYTQALRLEERVWVRRQILAQQVWCYQDLQQWPYAVQTFLALLASDPETPYFPCIPLLWTNEQTTAALDTPARTWFQKADPVESLIGASCLLSTARQSALDKLKFLSQSRDPRIAWLARAQIWKAEQVTSRPEDIAIWDAALEKIPAPLRGGPRFVVAQAYAHHGQFPTAALRYMQVAILHPQPRAIALFALRGAGHALEQQGDFEAAAGLYREILRDYPDFTTPVQEVRERLEKLANSVK